MKIKVNRQEKKFKPVGLKITLETREEEIFWISILNSSHITWKKIYEKGASSLQNMPTLSEQSISALSLKMSNFFYDLIHQTAEDTSNGD